MEATIRTKRYIACPKCGNDEKPIDHLEPGTVWGTWYCDDCGTAFSGAVDPDGSISVEIHDGERKVNTWDLLVLKPQSEPVYFIVPGMRLEGAGWREKLGMVEDEDHHKRFFYEEHSCPTNWLDPEHMQVGSDTDPHGLIEYVRTVDQSAMPPEELPHCGRQSWEWMKAFPELNTEGAEP